MAPPKSKVPQKVLALLAEKPTTLSALADVMAMDYGYVSGMLRALRRSGQIRVSAWVRRGTMPTQVWAAGNPAIEPDAPRPERGPQLWKPKPKPVVSDEDLPEDFPRIVRDLEIGITRHYSGVQP